jgi:hypothetical protein
LSALKNTLRNIAKTGQILLFELQISSRFGRPSVKINYFYAEQ